MKYENIELTGSLNVSGSAFIPYGGSGSRDEYQISGSLFYNTDSGQLEIFTGIEEGWANFIEQSSASSAPIIADIEYLVVAGGGGGGAGYTTSTIGGGGGGGAGGYLSSSLSSIEAGSSITVTVGGGGTGQAIGSGNSTAGGDSSIASSTGTFFTTVTSTGGGRGGSYDNTAAGGDGGSGGGGAYYIQPGGSGTSGQGFDGGDETNSSPGYGNGGGGGASEVGSDGTGTAGGDGGDGKQSSITGTSTYYAGGGGGGIGDGDDGDGGTGGQGGGGTGGEENISGTAGTANTGGGGGGGGNNGVPGSAVTSVGGTGGSGVVILAYPTGSVKGTGGSYKINRSDGYKVHVFNSSGTFSVTSPNDSLRNTLDILGDDSCTAFYKFNENANDEAGNYNGTAEAGISWTSGYYGKAATFDGSSHISGVAPIAGFGQTISVWVYVPDSSEAGYRVWGQNDSNYDWSLVSFGYSAGTWSTGAQIRNTTTAYNYESVTTPNIIPGQWNHFTWTFDSGTQYSCSVNGVMYNMTTTNQAGTITSIPQNNAFCGRYYGQNDDIDTASGTKLDHVRLFNKQLTQAEINILYNE